MNNKIAVFITTFLRDELLKETIQSYVNFSPIPVDIFIADQNETNPERDKKIQDILKFFILAYPANNFYYYQLPFDCGLSYSRNTLVNEAIKLNYKYGIISADSIRIRPGDWEHLPTLLKHFEIREDIDVIGFNLENRVAWEYDIDLIGGSFHLTKPKFKIAWGAIPLIQCGIIKNFFIAKLMSIGNVGWDNDLKIAEHEDFFYRFKLANKVVYWTDVIKGIYIDFKPEEYKKFRDRMYHQFRDLLKKKWGLTGWVKLEK